MKKYLALLLAVVTVFTLAACGSKKENSVNRDPQKDTAPSTQNNQNAAPMELPDEPQALLQTVWDSYAESDKFYAMGGNYDEDESKNNNVENGPGKYALDNDGMTTVLMVPADKVADIEAAASLMHGMMSNNFTCGAYKLKEGVDAQAFGQAMYTSITSQRFLCGAPEAIFVAVLDGKYVVATYGSKQLLDVFHAKLTAAYPGTQVLYNQLITE